METDDFEWDDDKAASNATKHGITFEMATLAFDDPFAIEDFDIDDSTDEPRERLIGMAEELLLFVVYTFRYQRRRIISARLATPRERRQYHDEN